MTTKQKYFAILAAILIPTVILSSLISGGGKLFKGSLTDSEINNNCTILKDMHGIIQSMLNDGSSSTLLDATGFTGNINISSSETASISLNRFQEENEACTNNLKFQASSNLVNANVQEDSDLGVTVTIQFPRVFNLPPGTDEWYDEIFGIYNNESDEIPITSWTKYNTEDSTNHLLEFDINLTENTINNCSVFIKTLEYNGEYRIDELKIEDCDLFDINLSSPNKSCYSNLEIENIVYDQDGEVDYISNSVPFGFTTSQAAYCKYKLNEEDYHNISTAYTRPDTSETVNRPYEMQGGLEVNEDEEYTLEINCYSDSERNSFLGTNTYNFETNETCSYEETLPAFTLDLANEQNPYIINRNNQEITFNYNFKEMYHIPGTDKELLNGTLYIEYLENDGTFYERRQIINYQNSEEYLVSSNDIQAKWTSKDYPQMDTGSYKATMTFKNNEGAISKSSVEFELLVEDIKECNLITATPTELQAGDSIHINYTDEENRADPITLRLGNNTMAQYLNIETNSEGSTDYLIPADLTPGIYTIRLNCADGESDELNIIISEETSPPEPQLQICPDGTTEVEDLSECPAETESFIPTCSIDSDKIEYNSGEEVSISYNYSPATGTQGKFYLKAFENKGDNNYEELALIKDISETNLTESTGDQTLKWTIPENTTSGNYTLYIRGTSIKNTESHLDDPEEFVCFKKTPIKVTNPADTENIIDLSVSQSSFIPQEEDLSIDITLHQDVKGLLVNVYKFTEANELEPSPIATIFHHCANSADLETTEECGLNADEYELVWEKGEQPSYADFNSQEILISATAWQTIEDEELKDKQTAIAGPISVIEARTDIPSKCQFIDVPANDPDFEAITEVCKAGYFTGADSDKGRVIFPDTFLKRIEAVTVSNRASGCLIPGSYTYNDGNLGFTDLDRYLSSPNSLWILTELKKATTDCVTTQTPTIQGDANHKVRPEETTTFYEFAKIVIISMQNGHKTNFPLFVPNTSKSPWYEDFRLFLNMHGLPSLADNAPMRRRDAINFIYNLQKANLITPNSPITELIIY